MKKGFTLIEILVAVTIIAVLVSIGVVSYASVNKRSRDAKRKGDVEQLRSALEMYRSDIGSYPDTTGSGSWTDASDLSTPLVSTYLPAIPSDPKSSQKYRYKATNSSGGNYYGYCLTAYLESAEENDTCTPDSGSQPVGTYMYGVKSP